MNAKQQISEQSARPEPFDARDGVITRDELGRYVISWSRQLKHSPERVWRAVTDQSEVGIWARGSWAFEPRVGGQIRLCLDNSRPEEEQIFDPGVITAYEPPRLLEFRVGAYEADTEQDGEHIIRWTVEPNGDGCLLGFSDTFELGRRVRNSIACGWQYMLDQFEVFVSTGSADWSTLDAEMERIYWRYRKMARPDSWS